MIINHKQSTESKGIIVRRQQQLSTMPRIDAKRLGATLTFSERSNDSRQHQQPPTAPKIDARQHRETLDFSQHYWASPCWVYLNAIRRHRRINVIGEIEPINTCTNREPSQYTLRYYKSQHSYYKKNINERG